MLLGLLAGMAAPRYQQALDDAALRSAAKRLAADLRHARQVARTRARSVTIEFSVDTNSYQAIDSDQAVLTDPDQPEGGLSVQLGERVSLAASLLNGPSLSRVEFDFRGDPIEAGVIHLTDGRQVATVSVNALGVVEVTP